MPSKTIGWIRAYFLPNDRRITLEGKKIKKAEGMIFRDQLLAVESFSYEWRCRPTAGEGQSASERVRRGAKSRATRSSRSKSRLRDRGMEREDPRDKDGIYEGKVEEESSERVPVLTC